MCGKKQGNLIMNTLNNNKQYAEQLNRYAQTNIDWEKLKGKTVLITGASGMIGTYMIDLIMHRNQKYKNYINVIAMSRNEGQARERFSEYWNMPYFHYISQNINEEIVSQNRADYVIHAASNTHPKQYSSDPVNTILTNVLGTKNILDYAYRCRADKVIFLSSVEIYGENKGDVDLFDESYSGYIDCNTLRAGYPEGKRTGEALCQAYRSMYNMNIIIPRVSRVYGPTMKAEDSKAIAQFIKNAVYNQNIVLKSEGNQLYSYIYVGDAVMAILYCILYGEDGQAYNVSGDGSDISLKSLAEYLADMSHTQVVYELPEESERRGYSKAAKALLDNSKIKNLGWNSLYDIKTGLYDTIHILKDI